MAVELTESQINGRFQLLNRPMALPGKCAVCGAVDRPCVDFGLDLDFYGAVVFCVECLSAAAEILGLKPQTEDETAQLVQRQHLQQALEVADEFVSRLSSLHSDFSARVSSLPDLHVPSDVKEPGITQPGDSDDNTGDDGKSTDRADSDVTETERPANQEPKSSRNKRSDRVPASSSDGELFDFQ